jgi:hypothetical protein
MARLENGADGRRLISSISDRGLRMVELVLFACLLAQPTRCETFHIPFTGEMFTHACVWQSQIQIAQWAGAHPEWVVKRVSCEMPKA